MFFSKEQALTLPPYRPYDRAIDRLPRATLPTSQLDNLSRPEHQGIAKNIYDSLAAGLIRPSSSSVGAGFFFVEKNTNHSTLALTLEDSLLKTCAHFLSLILLLASYTMPPSSLN